MTRTPGALDQRLDHKGRTIPRGRLAARIADALGRGSLIVTAGAGYGKTMALEQGLEGHVPAWLSCTEAERAPGTLLVRIVGAVADAAPGASDAVAERLATGVERVEVMATTRELIADLTKLLVEPLVLVIDDAEQLDGADASERLISELIRAEAPLLRIAVASRRPLDLRVAKPRAAGRLTELGTKDLAFDSEECEAVLRMRSGRAPSPQQVSSVMEATEGWPLGIALVATVIGRGGAESSPEALAGLTSTPDLHAYLSEELFASLEPDLLEAAIDSCVTRMITPEVARALGLDGDYRGRIERAGLMVRSIDGGKGFAYHPLLREFLLDRLEETRSEDARRSLHAAVAPAVAAQGDAIGAVEHWIEAGRWPEAVAAIEEQGPILLRTSPELLTRWLGRLPADVQELPTIRMLEGQLLWGAGQHERAVEPLREAVQGYRDARDPQREWLARFFLAEAVFSAGPFEEILELAEGWDSPDAPDSNMGVVGVAWYAVLALTTLGRRNEAEALASRLREDRKGAAQFRYLADLASLINVLAAGGAGDALIDLSETIRELELNDPQGRLAVSQSVTGLVHLDIGEADAALEWFERCQQEAERMGLEFIARDAHLQRASLLAQRGLLPDAQIELELAGPRQGTGWRGVSRPKAEALVASAHGDRREAVAAAERALDRVRPGLVCYRVWAALDMATVLAGNASADRATSAVTEALEVLDDLFPGELGSYHRARLLAARAWLEFEGDRREAAYESLRLSLQEAGDRMDHVARAQWTQLKPVLSSALEEGAVAADQVLPALVAAVPADEGLIELIDHSHPVVRREALSAALATDHPDVLSKLPSLVEDSDPEVASAAISARERLRDDPPPLRYGLLGRFRVTRSGREIAESAWARPIDSRLVRFLAVHAGETVPEDLVFEALWSELSASSARRSLQVAVSRARKVLDLPGAEHSVIESADRSYGLVLRGRDAIDAEEFMSATELGLAEREEPQRDLLGSARSLWHGEPLPEDRYDDWATPYRERLTDHYIAVLTALIGLHERSDEHGRSADLARELVDLDPLNEEGHRALMTAYSRTGRRGHALRQYLECRRALVDSLGVEPAEETSRLQGRILAGESV
jgi:ATP/maltotriose-dependent transcriptional regulator MalT/DNA-binding SARP family transcriptional activator